MARYIDADDLLNALKEERKNGNFVFTSKWIKEIMDNLPAADVVPKREVDRLVDKWIGEENLTQDAMVLRLIEALRDEAKRYEKYYFNHEYDKLIAEAKQEVAREIFEEIENFITNECLTAKDSRDIEGYVKSSVHYAIAELKKKYTEGK